MSKEESQKFMVKYVSFENGRLYVGFKGTTAEISITLGEGEARILHHEGDHHILFDYMVPFKNWDNTN